VPSLLGDPVVRRALEVTARTNAIANLLIILLGTPTAYVLATRRFRGRSIVVTLVELPLVLPPAVAGIGLLAALLSVQRGLETHVLDRVTDGVKPQLVADLGATYHHGSIAEAAVDADVVVECTGVAQLVLDAMVHNAADGIVCLTGVSSGGRTFDVDAGLLNRTMVLSNDVVFGSVNANRRHYELGADALAKADHGWLDRIITRRVPQSDWRSAYVRRPDDVKVVLEFAS